MPGVVLLPKEVEIAFKLPAPVIAPAMVMVAPAVVPPVGLFAPLLPPVIASSVRVLPAEMEIPRVALPSVVVWVLTIP